MDSAGRTIMLRKPKPLKQYNLIRILGEDATPAYASMCTPLIWIESIDGIPVAAIEKRLHIDNIIETLDECGLEAVNNAVLDNLQEKDRAEVIEEIKK
jgi:hypothetical protein